MKKLLTVAALVLAPLALIGSPSGLSWSCVDGTGVSGNCAPGHVTFTGTGYPSPVVHVRVTDSSGSELDDFDYNTQGNLNFTETLVPAGTYSVTISVTGWNSTQNITVGEGY